MATEINQDLVLKLKNIVTSELPLSELSDEQLHYFVLLSQLSLYNPYLASIN